MLPTKIGRNVCFDAVKERERIRRQDLESNTESVKMRQPELEIGKDRVLIGQRFHRVSANAKKRRAVSIYARFGTMTTGGAVQLLEHHVGVNIYDPSGRHMISQKYLSVFIP